MRKKKKRKKKRKREEEEKELLLPDENTMLGVITQFLGYDRAKVLCADGQERLCRIPGKLKKRMWMRLGDIVLVAPWEFKNERGDIIYRYTTSEVQKLKKMDLLKELEEFIELGI